jgi:hypothetical protein
MVKRRTIYKVVFKKGVGAVSDTQKAAKEIQKLYKKKSYILKSSTTAPYGSNVYWKIRKVI